MKLHWTRCLALIVIALAAGCASNSVIYDATAGLQPYRYGGEKYGTVTVECSSELSKNRKAVSFFRELGLDSAIVSHLIAHGLYDPQAANSIAVTIRDFGFARDTTASRGHSVVATVTLKDGANQTLTRFVVNTKVFFSGGDGRIDDSLGALRGNFGEQTAKAIEQMDQSVAGKKDQA